MRSRNGLLLVVVLLVIFSTAPSMAAGTATVTLYRMAVDSSSITWKIACTGDSSAGTVPAVTIATADYVEEALKRLGIGYHQYGYYLYEVLVVAGSPAPDSADIAITDATGATLYTEAAVIPASGSNYGTIAVCRAVHSALTVTVSNQVTASAKWDIYVTLAR